MKYILQIAAALKIGGAEKVTRDIGLYSDPDEYQNHYIVFGTEIGAYEKELEERGCRIFHIDSPGKGYRKFSKNLKEILSACPYTAVHAHTMFNAGWAMYMAKKEGVPVRVAHAHSALTTDAGLRKKLYESVMRHMILTCSTDLVACGEKAGIRLFGETAYRKRAKLILNGVNTEGFRFDENGRQRIRQELKIGDGLLIGHMGHLTEVKNQRFLIDLMPLILDRRPDAKLILLGEGEDRPALEKQIETLGLRDNVIMTGNVMNVSDYLSAMDVFAFPSFYEGMPLSVLEVQANGLPCVLSTGVPEDVYITDLVHPVSLEKPEEWVDRILCQKRTDPERYAGAMTEKGYDTASAMEKIYAIYNKTT